MFEFSKFRPPVIWLFLLAVAPVFSSQGPTISGNIDVNVTTGNISNSAIGSASIADIQIGSIISGDINGFVKIVVKTGDIVNSAEGTDSVSKVRIGNIGQ